MKTSEIDKALEKFKIEYKAIFVPQSMSRNANEKRRSLNWLCSITRQNHTFSFPYTQGIAHVPNRPKFAYGITLYQDEQDQIAAERGLYHNSSGGMNILPPLLPDVLSSLLLDSYGTDNSFSEWCLGLGENDDSIKAKALYDECSNIARELRRLFTPAELADLANIFEGY